MKKKIQQLLSDHNLRKTKIREEVLEVFLKNTEALSHQVIKSQFEFIDRITLYRTLKTFEKKGIIHKAFDGTKTAKYALCDSCSVHQHEDNHAHFHCNDCGKTICLEDIEAPSVLPPKGMQVKSTYYVMKGLCGDCAS